VRESAPPPRRILRAAAKLFAGTLASRALGFVRMLLMAHYFGGRAAMDAFNIALDKQEVTDPDERALLWELAQGHRHVRGQFGEKLDESAAVKAVRDRRTAWLEAERTKWEQGKQTAAESVADGKPQVTPSTEPPPKEDSGDPGDLDEEKEWEAKMAAKATEVST